MGWVNKKTLKRSRIKHVREVNIKEEITRGMGSNRLDTFSSTKTVLRHWIENFELSQDLWLLFERFV